MSPSKASERQPASEIEQEVDFGIYLRRLARGWWVIVAAILIGAVLGLAFTLGPRNLYRGEATIYLGQPLAVGSSVQIQGLNTNPSTITQLIHSNDVLGVVSKRSGLPEKKLEAGVSSATVSGFLSKQGQTPLVTISVQAHAPKDVVTKATNTLAKVVLARISDYPKSKMATMEQQIASDRERIAAIDKGMKVVENGIASSKGSTVEQQVLMAQVVQAQASLSASLNSDIRSNQLLIAQIKTVEQGKIVTLADAQKTTGHSRKSALAVGAALGLVLGALFVLAAPRFRRKRTA
jgi:uncharacterized protein involved in exopolysaccharide biosynthesis